MENRTRANNEYTPAEVASALGIAAITLERGYRTGKYPKPHPAQGCATHRRWWKDEIDALRPTTTV